MKPLVSITAIWLSAFTIPNQRVLSSKPFRVENPKSIASFTALVTKFNPSVGTYKFKKIVTPFDKTPDGKLITFSFSGDTIQYYKSGEKRFLYYCKFSNPALLSTAIPFLLKEKSAFISKKYWRYNRVRLEDITGFEDLDLIFSKNKIKEVIYTLHPD